MQERKTSHIFLYLTSEQMVFGVKQLNELFKLQRKNWIKQAKKEWSTRVRQLQPEDMN
jgi:hypothetical protein